MITLPKDVAKAIGLDPQVRASDGLAVAGMLTTAAAQLNADARKVTANALLNPLAIPAALAKKALASKMIVWAGTLRAAAAGLPTPPSRAQAGSMRPPVNDMDDLNAPAAAVAQQIVADAAPATDYTPYVAAAAAAVTLAGVVAAIAYAVSSRGK